MSLPTSCDYSGVAVHGARWEKEKNIRWRTCPSFILFALISFIPTTRISFHLWPI